MGRLLKRAGLIAVVLTGLVVLGWVSHSRADFGTWNPLAQPTRITYCDRTYLPGSHRTRAQIDAVGNGFGVFPFQQVGVTAAGALIYAKPLPDSVRYQYPNAPPLPCDMAIYVKVGADDYIDYGISGGP
jgi:hypothetical protein